MASSAMSPPGQLAAQGPVRLLWRAAARGSKEDLIQSRYPGTARAPSGFLMYSCDEASRLSRVSLTQILRKQWRECAAMDHPVTDQQSSRHIGKAWYPFRNKIVESIDRRCFGFRVAKQHLR